MKPILLLIALALFCTTTSVLANTQTHKAPNGSDFQWFYNGKMLANCNNQSVLAIADGLYEVSFTNEQGERSRKVVSGQKDKTICQVFLIGDSTMADYSLEEDYNDKRYPLYGWGQVFQSFMTKDSLALVPNIIKTDSVVVYDKAKGGRSTRTFFQEGRWREVYNQLRTNDVVLIQFGHNDAAEQKHERYVPIDGYKEFLRLYVTQAREKGAKPILVTPVARNYPWSDGKLGNVHGQYPDAMKAVATEMDVPLIDLNELSMAHFSAKGQDFVTANYFMNFGPGLYKAYPDGQKDNTHFQKQGAQAVAQLVFDALKKIAAQTPPSQKTKGKKTK